jgi:hypothetical protein
MLRPMVASYSKQVRSIHSDEPHFSKLVGKPASRVPLDVVDLLRPSEQVSQDSVSMGLFAKWKEGGGNIMNKMIDEHVDARRKSHGLLLDRGISTMIDATGVAWVCSQLGNRFAACGLSGLATVSV